MSVIRLTPEATQALLNCVSSRNSGWGANFLLIEANGALRKAGPVETVDWLQAVSWALAENLIVYNARSHTITHLVPAQTRRSLKGNPGSFLYKPANVELHGPTLHRASLSAEREIIKSGTYTWEEK